MCVQTLYGHCTQYCTYAHTHTHAHKWFPYMHIMRSRTRAKCVCRLAEHSTSLSSHAQTDDIPTLHLLGRRVRYHFLNRGKIDLAGNLLARQDFARHMRLQLLCEKFLYPVRRGLPHHLRSAEMSARWDVASGGIAASDPTCSAQAADPCAMHGTEPKFHEQARSPHRHAGRAAAGLPCPCRRPACSGG